MIITIIITIIIPTQIPTLKIPAIAWQLVSETPIIIMERSVVLKFNFFM